MRVHREFLGTVELPGLTVSSWGSWHSFLHCKEQSRERAMCCPYVSHLMLRHEISYLICHMSLALPILRNPCRKLGVSLTSTCALQDRLSHLSSAPAIPACCLQKTLGSQIPKMLTHPAPKFMSRETEAWRKSLMKRNIGNDMCFMCTGKDMGTCVYCTKSTT